MKIGKYLGPILISLLLICNLVLTSTIIENQERQIEYINGLTDHINVLTDNVNLMVVQQKQEIAHLEALTEHVMLLTEEVYTQHNVAGKFSLEGGVDVVVHMGYVWRDKNGYIKGLGEHAGVLTTGGKNYIEGLLGNNSTDPSAQWIALSASTNTPQAAWTGIPAEINANNLTKAQGAYTSTGDGVHTIVYTFTASGNQEVRLGGLYWSGYPVVTNGTLLFADTMTLASMVDDDTLEVTATVTITGA